MVVFSYNMSVLLKGINRVCRVWENAYSEGAPPPAFVGGNVGNTLQCGQSTGTGWVWWIIEHQHPCTVYEKLCTAGLTIHKAHGLCWPGLGICPALVPLQKFPIDYQIFQWKCPLEIVNGLVFSRPVDVVNSFPWYPHQYLNVVPLWFDWVLLCSAQFC